MAPAQCSRADQWSCSSVGYEKYCPIRRAEEVGQSQWPLGAGELEQMGGAQAELGWQRRRRRLRQRLRRGRRDEGESEGGENSSLLSLGLCRRPARVGAKNQAKGERPAAGDSSRAARLG